MEEIPKEKNGHTLQRLSTLKKSIALTGIKIPMRQCSTFQIKLAPYLLNKPYSPNIISDSEGSLDKRVVLLKESINEELEGIPEDIKNWIHSEKDNGVEVITYNLDVGYKSYGLEQILIEFLPSGVGKDLKVESIGDIKILDLTPEQISYKDFIGNILLEKSPLTHTVLLRIKYQSDDPLGKYFSHSKYELLCGEPKTEIEIVEGPCKFKIDLLKIYYESILQDERERILSVIGKDNVICDMFGDLFYSIRAAKVNHSHVSANCNSHNNLYEAFSSNLTSNGVETYVNLHNENLYSFLEESLKKEYVKDGNSKHVNHIYVPNFLEDCSFLKIFVGLFNKIGNQVYENEHELPLIHFYLFVNNEEFTDSMKRVLTTKFNKIFNESFTNKEVQDIFHTDDFDTIFIVRDDLTRKLLQCTIKLSKKVAYCSESLVEHIVTIQPKDKIEEEPEEKKDVIIEEKEETKNEKESKAPTKSTPAKKSKKEIVKKPSKTTEDLEKDEEITQEQDGPRRSSRKKTKPKQYEEFEYAPAKSQRESSK